MDPFDHDLERGLRNRRAMLGDAWVDQAAAKANSFNAEFQNFISRVAWHEIWGRPGLDAKTRRVIVLAVTTALGRWEEFELHLRAALAATDDTRLAPDEVKEVLMQCAVYAGVPAANTAVGHAMKVLRELGHTLAPHAATEASHPGTGRSQVTASRPALHVSIREARESSRAASPRHTVVLAHSLACDMMMWDELANALADTHRVICYDHRGQGRSEVPPGPYTLAQLADDAARVIDEFAHEPVVFIGLSMGGMVAQELALRHPQHLKALVIANSSSGYPSDGRAMWDQRIATVRAQGMAPIADGLMPRWFSEGFRAAHASTVARLHRRAATQSPDGFIATCEALRELDTTGRLHAIKVPTLVIAGELDPGTPVAMSELIASGIAGARLHVIAGAQHMSATERPQEFERVVREFLMAL
jgi:3-oxoadipate enol-lactonase